MERQAAENYLMLVLLRTEYRQVRLDRIAQEEQFNSVDGVEAVSTDTHDSWWKVLQAQREKEEWLAARITALERKTGQAFSCERSSAPTLIKNAELVTVA